MEKLLRFAPLLMLISCASVQSTVIETNGKQTHKVTCSEFNSSLEECKSSAGKLCTNDYRVVAHHKEVYADSGDGFYMPAKHHLMVECH
jgi:hypothetical protein